MEESACLPSSERLGKTQQKRGNEVEVDAQVGIFQMTKDDGNFQEWISQSTKVHGQ